MSNQVKEENKLAQQVNAFLSRNPNVFKDLQYGEVRLEIRDGNFYRLIVSSSILVRSEDSKGNAFNE